MIQTAFGSRCPCRRAEEQKSRRAGTSSMRAREASTVPHIQAPSKCQNSLDIRSGQQKNVPLWPTAAPGTSLSAAMGRHASPALVMPLRWCWDFVKTPIRSRRPLSSALRSRRSSPVPTTRGQVAHLPGLSL